MDCVCVRLCVHVWSCQLLEAAASRLDCHVADWVLQFLSRAKPFFSATHTLTNTVGLSICAGSNGCPGFRIAICQSHSLYVLESYVGLSFSLRVSVFVCVFV